jgi:hypothetical protein
MCIPLEQEHTAMSTRLIAALKHLAAPKTAARPVRRELRPLSTELLARVGGGNGSPNTPKKFW